MEEEEEEKVSLQEMVEMTQKHTEEMSRLQREYELAAGCGRDVGRGFEGGKEGEGGR